MRHDHNASGFNKNNMAQGIVYACVTLALMVISIDAESDPCGNFTVIEHNGDRGTSCSYEETYCDSFLTARWYRFQEDNKTFPIVTTECPDDYMCRTGTPIWLNGTHPEEADGIVERTACLRYFADCCQTEKVIKIKRCANFYVYFLNESPFACDSRYCLDSDLPCPTPPPTTTSPSMSSMNSTAVFQPRRSSVLFSVLLSAYPILNSILD